MHAQRAIDNQSVGWGPCAAGTGVAHRLSYGLFAGAEGCFQRLKFTMFPWGLAGAATTAACVPDEAATGMVDTGIAVAGAVATGTVATGTAYGTGCC